MSNLHRLAWIDSQIRDKRYPNSRTISEQFEISLRQAQRDIEYLRYSMGAPLEYSTENSGYFYTDHAYILPSGFISGEEKKTLSYLANQYKMTESEDAKRVADLFSRLIGEEAGECNKSINIPVLNVAAEETEFFNILIKAIRMHRKIIMTYRSTRGETGVRVFHPYKLFRKEKLNYTVGFCELRNEIRVFRISRIIELKMTEEDFTVSPGFNGEEYGSMVGFKFNEPYSALIEFEKEPELQQFKLDAELKYGNTYKIRFYNSEEILSMLLSKTVAFNIIFPNWLKERLKDKLKKLYNMNFRNDIICRS